MPRSRIVGTANFDLLRAKLEFEIERPVVIAITSSTDEDGKEIVARGLADSFVSTGYRTLFMDSCLPSRSLAKPTQRLTLEEAARRVPPDAGTGKLAVLYLGDVLVQKSTSQRHVQSAFEIFRAKFDYIVINTDYFDPTAFAAIVVYTADAVLVTVRKGRRENVDDVRLATALERIGERFLGVVALDASLFRDDQTITAVQLPDWRRSQKVLVDQEQRRETADSPK